MGIKLAAFSFLLLTFLSGIPFAATCGADAYAKACSQCSFDESGKMDKTCYDGFTNQGKACAIASDPVAAAQYNEGKCPGMQHCLDRLEACKAEAATGYDKLDCNGGQVKGCFAAADACIETESSYCHDITPDDVENLLCAGPLFGVILLFGFVTYSRKK